MFLNLTKLYRKGYILIDVHVHMVGAGKKGEKDDVCLV